MKYYFLEKIQTLLASNSTLKILSFKNSKENDIQKPPSSYQNILNPKFKKLNLNLNFSENCEENTIPVNIIIN